jgi:hypothetical protein
VIPHHLSVRVWKLKLKGERYGEGGSLARAAAFYHSTQGMKVKLLQQYYT